MDEDTVSEPRKLAMTCDVEDYFQVSAFEDLVPRSTWTERECRIPSNVDKALQLLEDYGARATFFTLGWVAQNYPNVVRRIVDAGHELASHGMEHRRVWSQTADEFLEDATTAKKLLEDIGGTAVQGYRAASWSIDSRTPWAHEMLLKAGYRYSSSIYPISHDSFGMPNAMRSPHEIDGLLEVPASTVRMFGRNMPAAGGGYFRLFPLALSRHFIRKHESGEDGPFVFYFHPWELDPAQPRMEHASRKLAFRHYLNLDKFEARLAGILRTFNWDRMDRLVLNGGS